MGRLHDRNAYYYITSTLVAWSDVCSARVTSLIIIIIIIITSTVEPVLPHGRTHAQGITVRVGTRQGS